MPGSKKFHAGKLSAITHFAKLLAWNGFAGARCLAQNLHRSNQSIKQSWSISVLR